MNTAEIQRNIEEIISSFSKTDFIYALLLAYGIPKASISRLKKGNLNLSKNQNEVLWKNKLFYKPIEDGNELHAVIDRLNDEYAIGKSSPRFIVVTDFETFLAIDTKTKESLDIPLLELPKHYAYFLPWAGIENEEYEVSKEENPADKKAAEKMAKLFDEIKKDNPDNSPDFVHSLNVFLSRLLFCFFAEDTHIFEKNQFTNSIESYTKNDGSDLDQYFSNLFIVLNTDKKDRDGSLNHLDGFPYVNGGLFKVNLMSPIFTGRSRKAIIESGKLDWSEINPDIFGSMIQAVVSPEMRGEMGMHYTSVENIMKVITPLFLKELSEEFSHAKENLKKLEKLQDRLAKIKIFDPACGSGNFLIIVYKELRKLEMKIISEKQNLQKDSQVNLWSGIALSNFYGIELDDFAHEIAILSLWLAEHQMNLEFHKTFGSNIPSLPLKKSGYVVRGNACRLNWEEVCPKRPGDEIYILGNPPYLGAKRQNQEHKMDIKIVYGNYGAAKKLDYISCWFLKASRFIEDVFAKYSFVTTNSICQGEQVALIWKHVLGSKLEINFAYTSFKWTNRAKKNAGVTIAIIGLRNKSPDPKYLFVNQEKYPYPVQNINAYLANYRNVYISRRTSPLSFQKIMEYGNMAIDGGNLILSPHEKNNLIKQYPLTQKIIKQIFGAQEFLNGIERYCLWIKDSDLSESLRVPEIEKRINKVREKRLSIKDKGSQDLAKKPHQFREMKEGIRHSVIIPTVSSERRDYIPMSYIDKKSVIIAPNQAIYDAEPWLLSVLTSRMHMVWVRTVAGRLKTDYRYSSSLCYNTFPFPSITEQRKEEITQCVYHILDEREKHSGKTLAQLYDPNKMPEGLREAHRLNDLAIERCYRSKPFVSDEERLEYLFKLYEKMIKEVSGGVTS